jgi:hypothetical protein
MKCQFCQSEPDRVVTLENEKGESTDIATCKTHEISVLKLARLKNLSVKWIRSLVPGRPGWLMPQGPV